MTFWCHNDVIFASCARWVAADVFAPWVVSVAIQMISVAIVLTMHDKRIPVFHKEFFQLPAPSQ